MNNNTEQKSLKWGEAQLEISYRWQGFYIIPESQSDSYHIALTGEKDFQSDRNPIKDG